MTLCKKDASKPTASRGKRAPLDERPAGRRLLESDIQARVIARAMQRNVYVRKVICIGRTGFPDLYLLRDGLAVLWEVKAVAGRLMPRQALEHRLIKDAGGKVFVTFGLWDAYELLEELYP